MQSAVGLGEVTDAAWAELEPLLPASGGRGKPWRDHLNVINGILWTLRTGAPWGGTCPSTAEPWRTAYTRFRRWQTDEV